jgi:protein regulator of cytokinesis 1
MDTSIEERRLFDHVTCNISASVDEVTVPGALALDLIEQVFKVCRVHRTVRLNK